MIYAAHQPNYLPWLGYFYKIMQCDFFVILDDVQFVRGRSYQNRVQIKSLQGAQWLTEPVLRKGKNGQQTSDVGFNPDTDWRRKHLSQIRSNYAKTPFFNPFFGQLEQWLMDSEGSLSDVNTALIRKISGSLGIGTEFVLSSSLDVGTVGAERIADIGTKIRGTVYLSGRGAAKYQSEGDFLSKGIEMRYTDFSASPYSQLHGGFVEGLSVIDAIFNIGVDGVARLLAATGDSSPCFSTGEKAVQGLVG